MSVPSINPGCSSPTVTEQPATTPNPNPRTSNISSSSSSSSAPRLIRSITRSPLRSVTSTFCITTFSETRPALVLRSRPETNHPFETLFLRTSRHPSSFESPHARYLYPTVNQRHLSSDDTIPVRYRIIIPPTCQTRRQKKTDPRLASETLVSHLHHHINIQAESIPTRPPSHHVRPRQPFHL